MSPEKCILFKMFIFVREFKELASLKDSHITKWTTLEHLVLLLGDGFGGFNLFDSLLWTSAYQERK